MQQKEGNQVKRYGRYTWYDYEKYARKARRRERMEKLFTEGGPVADILGAVVGGLMFGSLIGWGLLFP